MILALALCCTSLSPSQEPVSLTLSRGSELAGKSLRYWAVEDTVLDSKEQDKNYGGALFLEASPGRPLLIRFGDLNRAIGPNKRVVKASLRLAIGGGGVPLLRSVSRVLAPWGEGPILTITPMVLSATGQQATSEDVAAWSATWRLRHANFGASAWQVPGAQGTTDMEPISGAKATPAGDNAVRIEGLEAAVQYQLDHPLGNHGFLLQFDGATQFFSSQAASDRPALELQLTDAPPTTGPDLSVIRIEQTPAYERYAEPKTASSDQDGVSVALPVSVPNQDAQHWPKDGESVTYTAHIRNLGNAPVAGFTVRWSVAEKPGAAIDVAKSLAPGEETTATTTVVYKHYPNDHRFLPVRVSIEQKTPDACPANDSLEIQQNALSLKAVIAQSVADAFQKTNSGGACFGGHGVEDWLQGQFRFLNETAFPQSRFSFAKNGIVERVRLQDIAIVPDAEFQEEAAKAQADLSVDGAVLLPPGFTADPYDVSLEVLRKVASAIGLLRDFGSFGFPSPEDNWLQTADGAEPVAMSARDLYPGIMGYGDTRNEAMATPQAALPYGPFPDPMFSFILIEHTDLFSATDAAALNSQVGKRRGLPGAWLYKGPSLVFVNAKDYSGTPLANADLSFYQLAGGKVSTDKPAFTAKTDAGGLAILPKRPTGAAEGFMVAGGTPLKSTAFGRLSPNGENGMFLVKATTNGVSGYGFLKAWQVLDTVSRNATGPHFLTLRFNVSDQPIDLSTELAKGRIVTDKAQSLPAQLAALVDGNPETRATLSPAADAWLEIDLGRDRFISEIDLVTNGEPFWRAFDIAIYDTGQTSEEAVIIGQEVNWPWTSANRGQAQSGSKARSVAYRFRSRRARFIRFLNRAAVGAASLSEIRVHPPKGP